MKSAVSDRCDPEEQRTGRKHGNAADEGAYHESLWVHLVLSTPLSRSCAPLCPRPAARSPDSVPRRRCRCTGSLPRSSRSHTPLSCHLADHSQHRVCMTVGAQWPILNTFDTLRRRSVRVETLVKSPTRVRGIVGEGTGAVFVELVLPIADPYLRRDLRTGDPGHTPFPGSRASWRRPRRTRRRSTRVRRS